MADVKEEFEKISLEFTTLQNSLNELINGRSKLETQFQENKIVASEFDKLNEDSKIYKLTGPILMPQDYSEAKTNVTKRIEFIEGEIKRVESKINETEQKMETTRDQLLQIRMKMGQ
ncbi:uncharacterized protein KQ657_003302 [Scheffersomyces spartinae]|uniref:Prefoldin subunit 6 n=1 Tax=Scheffersomyces spartinae TaxID=45513 RepID=A0A9P7VCV6_9ASCO|nr:uncharacterized protein KQ657_003302 [Scheffersomyces spartinae]KAG7195539.1 hypothetical protein KQ657_003302 [Scheffersomyces spartinae]